MPHMEQIAGQLVGWLVTVGLSSAVGALMSRLRARGSRDSAMEDGMRALLRQKLLDLHESYVVEQRACPYDVKEQATDIHAAYKSLGGNSLGDHVYAEIMAAHVGGGKEVE